MRWWFKRSGALAAGCGSVVGLRRANNEDNFLFRGIHLEQKNGGLEQTLTWNTSLKSPVYLAVFDGMGGEANGEEAAWIAAKTLKEHADRLPRKRISLEDDDNGEVRQ